MDCQQLFSVIDDLNSKYCNIWEDVCNIESPTNYKNGVDKVGNIFIDLANEYGWHIEVLEHRKAGNAICITINHTAKKRAVVFSGHIDTVYPVGTFGTPAVRRDTDCIYGPGVMDCKGGVVAAFMAMDALYRCGFVARPVKLIIQTDEETGSKTSGKETIQFMLKHAQNAIAFLNTEGIQGNTAVLVRKGIIRYQFEVFGNAVHSSKCNLGANAIVEAAHKIIQLEKMKDIDGLTCNCGVIEGGTVANSVAERCIFTADIRYANEEQYEKAVCIVQDIADDTNIDGCRCEYEVINHRPAMPITDNNIKLLNKMNEIYKRSDLPILASRSCLSGSDAAYITQAGIPTVDNLGVDGGNIHSISEYARIDSLATSAKRLAAVAFYI